MMPSTKIEGAQWLSGRVFDSRPKGRGFKPHRRHCVVSLSKNINPILVLVQPRKIRPFITERLLMGRKEANQTNKSTKIGNTMTTRAKNKNIFECHQQIHDLHMYKDSDERFRALLLAHLSRRLMGELIVYQSLRRLSVVACPFSVCQQFQTSSPLKPLGQLNSNFIWKLLRMRERNYVQIVMVT